MNIDSLMIAFLGDIAFTGILMTEPHKNLARFQWAGKCLHQFETVFANLEVPIGVSTEKNEYKTLIHYSSREATKELLGLLNVSCVSIANNHIFDCKISGLKKTISLLDEVGICHTGAGWKKMHVSPIIVNCDGIRLAFMAYVNRSTNPKTEYFQEILINYLEMDRIRNDIASLRDNVDLVLVSLHWGVDYSYYPTPKQVKMARKIIDAGADIIMGHHPHTLQPFERYKDGYIFYSLGGLTFGDYMKEGKENLQALFRKTKKGVIVHYDTGSRKVAFSPTKELRGNYVRLDKRNYVKWSERRWLLYRIKNSSPFMIRLFDFHEKVLYRIYEYFFGYYQHPIKRLLQINNVFKIRRLFADMKAQN